MKRLLLIALLFSGVLNAQTSPFNKRSIEIDSTNEYTFLVGAHFHGASTNISGFPASSLLGNLDRINQSHSDFMICLGDLFLSLKNSQSNYQRSFFDKLEMPLFNAVGNHDVEEDNYEEFYGKRYFSFEIGQDAFIILDTEENEGDIDGKQLEMIRDVFKEKHSNVFIFAHRPIWSEEDEKLKDLFKGNTRSGTNYQDDVLPIVEKSNSKTWFFGGSLGGESPFSFFYYKKNDHLTYLATAIRDLPRDGILSVKVSNGEVSIEPMSFSDRKVENIEYYGLENWENTDGSKPFNWRLIKLYMLNMVKHRYFWYGIIWTLIGGVSLYFIRKWWRRKRAK